MSANETVTVRLKNKVRLNTAIAERMQQLGYKPFDYEALDMGFELPAKWPADSYDSPTLAQLTVLACKLKTVIVIGEITLMPREQFERQEHTQQVNRQARELTGQT